MPLGFLFVLDLRAVRRTFLQQLRSASNVRLRQAQWVTVDEFRKLKYRPSVSDKVESIRDYACNYQVLCACMGSRPHNLSIDKSFAPRVTSCKNESHRAKAGTHRLADPLTYSTHSPTPLLHALTLPYSTHLPTHILTHSLTHSLIYSSRFH